VLFTCLIPSDLHNVGSVKITISCATLLHEVSTKAALLAKAVLAVGVQSRERSNYSLKNDSIQGWQLAVGDYMMMHSRSSEIPLRGLYFVEFEEVSTEIVERQMISGKFTV